MGQILGSPGGAVPRARVERFASADALASGAADRVESIATRALRESGRFVVALAGGSTPRALYEQLAAPARASRIDWSRTHVFWGDERCVGPDDPLSNYRLARDTLLDHVPVPAAQVHRLRGEDPPTRAAAAYEDELRDVFATPGGAPAHVPGRRFDLVLLGMGNDGHTASLFPGSAAVRETRRWVVAEHLAGASMWRITLTPPVLNAAAHVVFLVQGSGKAVMLRRVLGGPPDADVPPAAMIVPLHGELTWLVDAAAAAHLEGMVR